MNLDLKNKITFVTGASKGIGATVARIFAEEGADVVVSYHQDHEGARRTAESVRSMGRQAWLCQMDVGDPQSIANAVRALPDHFQRLDILVLCAGKNVVTSFEEISADEWNEVLAVNLSGPFYVLQALTPLLNVRIKPLNRLL